MMKSKNNKRGVDTMKYSESQIELLETILTQEQDSLHLLLLDILEDFYPKESITESFGDYIFVRGDTAVLTVAHLDTVHKAPPKKEEIFLDPKKGIMWSPVGIGGDDRCGVFIILNLLFKGYRPYIAFVWDEEIGCIGSRKLVKDIDCFEVDFAVQFDRRGSGEAVYYDLDSPEFEDYISSFGFKTHIGSFSDISEICPAWDMAGVNLSAGYVREHTNSEMILLDSLYYTLDGACRILDDQIKNPTYFKYEEKEYLGYKKSSQMSFSDYDVCSYCRGDLGNNSTNTVCETCYYKFWED